MLFGRRVDADVRIYVQEVRAVHTAASDGGMRAAVGLPGMRRACPPCPPDRTRLPHHVGRSASGRRKVRAQHRRIARPASILARSRWMGQEGEGETCQGESVSASLTDLASRDPGEFPSHVHVALLLSPALSCQSSSLWLSCRSGLTGRGGQPSGNQGTAFGSPSLISITPTHVFPIALIFYGTVIDTQACPSAIAAAAFMTRRCGHSDWSASSLSVAGPITAPRLAPLESNSRSRMRPTCERQRLAPILPTLRHTTP